MSTAPIPYRNRKPGDPRLRPAEERARRASPRSISPGVVQEKNRFARAMEKIASKPMDPEPEPPKYQSLDAVKTAYVRGDLGYLELDERTMEALKWERDHQLEDGFEVGPTRRSKPTTKVCYR